MLRRANHYLKYLDKQNKKALVATYTVIFLICFSLTLAITLPIKDQLFDRFYNKETSFAAAVYPSDTTLTNIATPNVARPGYLSPYTDPTFGTKITRISDQTAFGSSNQYLRHVYAKISPFNSDGSKIMLSYNWPAILLNGSTYVFIRTFDNPSYSVWSNTNPNYVYGVLGNRFVRVDVSGTPQTTTLRTFTGYDSISLGEYEGNISNDDQFVALLARSGSATYLIVYNIATNTIVSTLDLGGRWPDWASMSQSGNFVVVSWAPDGSSRYQGMEVFNRSLTFLRQIDPQSSHGDMGYNQAGQEVYVSMADGYYPGATVRSVRLDGGGVTVIIDDTPGYRSGHISCRNLDRPGWCYLTSFTTTTSMPGYDEIFAMKIDSSNTVERFGHMHRTNTLGYDGQAHGSVNRDGTKVMFASDWMLGSSAPIYSYIAEMPASSATPTPTIPATPPGWNLILEDNFDGSANTAPDGSKWTADTGAGWDNGNNAAFYTPLNRSGSKNAYLDGSGTLVIEARQEDSYTGATTYNGHKYTSARMRSVQEFGGSNGTTATGGRIEWRAKFDSIQNGVWPALWTWGTGNEWPIGGELDMLEIFGNSEGNLGDSNVHYSNDTTDHPAGGTAHNVDTTGWHVYAVEWKPNDSPSTIRFTVDGNVIKTVSPLAYPSFNKFNQSIIMNVALNRPGGHAWMPQLGAGFTQFKAYVDYVKVYQPTTITPTTSPTPTGIAKMFATPESGTLTVGTPSNVVVNLGAGPAGEPFNAAQATVTVSSNLTVNSLTPVNCGFTYTATPTTQNPSFAGALLSDYSSGCTVYRLSVTPNTTGTGTITFTNGSIKSYATSNEVLSEITNGTYSLVAAATPTPTIAPTSTPIPPTATPTRTPTPVPPTATPTHTPTPAPTSTPVPPTATPTRTPTPSPTVVVTVPAATASAPKTYGNNSIISGTRTSASHSIYVNGSTTGVTYPTSTTWTASIPLSVGTNSVTVYARDLNGNQSTTTNIVVARHKTSDINGDGLVDLADISLLGSDWQKSSGLNNDLSDIDSDGSVNLTDFSILARLFGL